eukprot:Trichotokara_eunicae@DN2325_c0_g1_i1.p1
MKLRNWRLCCCTTEDLFVAFGVLTALLAVLGTLAEIFIVEHEEKVIQIYVPTFLAVSSALCFLQVLPSWKARPWSSNVLGATAVLQIGNALGFGLCLIWLSNKSNVVDGVSIA